MTTLAKSEYEYLSEVILEETLLAIQENKAEKRARAALGLQKAADLGRKARDAIKGASKGIRRGRAPKPVDDAARTDIMKVAVGQDASKQIYKAMEKNGANTVKDLQKLSAAGKIKGLDAAKLERLKTKVLRGDEIAKNRGLNVVTKVKVGGKTKTLKMGDVSKKQLSLNDAAKSLGVPVKFKLTAQGGAKIIANKVGPNFYSRLKDSLSSAKNFFSKPRDKAAALKFFKDLGRNAINFIKKNPLKVGIGAALSLAALGLAIYQMFKGEEDPQVTPEIEEAVENDPEEVTPPPPGYIDPPMPGPSPSPSGGTSALCRINNRLLKDNPDLGPDLKAAYKKLQSYLVDAGYESLMPKTLENGKDNPDGICGDETIEAIKKFQQDNPPLKVDGLYGPLTHAKMQEVLKNKPNADMDNDPEVEYRLERIEQLKEKLKNTTDEAERKSLQSQIAALEKEVNILMSAKFGSAEVEYEKNRS